jgi:glycosyltransferase involved in cell wall biosynthesis
MTMDLSPAAASRDTLMPRVSVIIPHLNTPGLLARCLGSVTAQTLDHGSFEIIVVDNGSRTPLDDIRAAFPDVRFNLEPAPGPGLARNRGIGLARAATLAFIDADCHAETGWLQTAVDAVEALPGQAIIGGEITIETADPVTLTPIEAFERVFSFRQQMYIEKRHFSVTANLAISAPVAQAVGPFGDVNMAEDIDWGRRAFAAGFPTRYEPRMRVWHPAQLDFDALVRKWRRIMSHDYNDHFAAGRPMWRWVMLAAMVAASVIPDSARILVSPKLRGIGNRWRGMTMLAKIRLFRAREMLHMTHTAHHSSAVFWNR